MAGEQVIPSTAYDTRRGLLSRAFARPEARKGGRYYELSAAEGDPFRQQTENLTHYLGGDWLPFVNNYRMVLRRAWLATAALQGYKAFIDLKEGRITQEEYDEKRAKTLHNVEESAKFRGLHPKVEGITGSGSKVTYTRGTRTTTIEIRGNFKGNSINLSKLLAGIVSPLEQPSKEEPVPQPTFGEKNYSYLGYQSASGKPEDSDADRVFEEYVTAAMNTLVSDHNDPEVDRAKAVMAATHRLRRDLVHHKRTRRGMILVSALLHAGEKEE